MATKQKSAPPTQPYIGNAQIRLLERLCNACGVSGNESEVRKIVLEQVNAFASEVHVDALGNVLAIRRGLVRQPIRVMVAAHMDEVGMMLIHDEGEGIFRFDIIGDLNVAYLPGKPVLIGKEHVLGVIGYPIYFPDETEAEEHPASKIPRGSLRIDVSPDNAKRVKIGDYATFSTAFCRLGPSLRARAMDDRIGVATLIELLRYAPPNIDLMAAFTVQEEAGLRGAQVAAYALDPDLALVLDCTLANDLPIWEGEPPLVRRENTLYNTHLGEGPAIYISDASTIHDPRLIRHLIQTAEQQHIPYQIRQPGSGETDASAVQIQRAGIPSVSLSVPGRYIHTPATIIRLEDWKNCLRLAYAALCQLSPATLDDRP
jgi:tetrahedral aminopeptidase